jgi:hypothetical protein
MVIFSVQKRENKILSKQGSLLIGTCLRYAYMENFSPLCITWTVIFGTLCM